MKYTSGSNSLCSSTVAKTSAPLSFGPDEYVLVLLPPTTTVFIQVIGVDFWSHCLTKRATIYARRRATVEQLLGAHISRTVLESLANDRNPAVDHDDATQFTLKVEKKGHLFCLGVPFLGFCPPHKVLSFREGGLREGGLLPQYIAVDR